jgi:hypothetical protein
MKKLIVLIGLIAITGCKKQEAPKSNCGTVVAKGYKIDSLGNAYDYGLGIRNELTNNQISITPGYFIWSATQLGDRYCVDGVESW